MRALSKLAVVVVALGSASVAQADLITIDFDDIAVGTGDEPGTLLTNQFESNGLIFDGAWVHGGLSAPRGSPPNWVSGEEVTDSLMNPGVITGFFVNPTDNSQAATIDYVELLSAFVDSDTTVTLSVFDIVGIMLGSVSRSGSSGILAISLPDIYSFTFSHINSGFNGIDGILGFDNLVFNTTVIPTPDPTPVPEPGTLGLFGIGLFALLFRQRQALLNVHRMPS